MKKVIVSVINDLVTDQRVNRVCITLQSQGFDVLLAGRKLSNSLPVQNKPYKTKRMRLLFTKGVFFYAEYNIRLFFLLLFKRFDILHSNDLDTLPANFIISKIRRKKLVYDSHEYFTEVPELIGRKLTRNIWLKIEQFILPEIKNSYTVCDSLADEYNKKYGIQMKVIQNLPLYKKEIPLDYENIKKNDDKIILYQGALNVGRGIEHVIRSMKYIEKARFVIIGDGDIKDKLMDIAKTTGLGDKIIFLGRIPFDKLHAYTKQADVGISLEENLGLSYYYSLPNKIFDYIHAEIPVLASPLPEIKAIINKYKTGLIVENHNPHDIADKLKEILFTIPKHFWKDNLKNAKNELCWEKQEYKLINLYENLK